MLLGCTLEDAVSSLSGASSINRLPPVLVSNAFFHCRCISDEKSMEIQKLSMARPAKSPGRVDHLFFFVTFWRLKGHQLEKIHQGGPAAPSPSPLKFALGYYPRFSNSVIYGKAFSESAPSVFQCQARTLTDLSVLTTQHQGTDGIKWPSYDPWACFRFYDLQQSNVPMAQLKWKNN